MQGYDASTEARRAAWETGEFETAAGLPLDTDSESDCDGAEHGASTEAQRAGEYGGVAGLPMDTDSESDCDGQPSELNDEDWDEWLGSQDRENRLEGFERFINIDDALDLHTLGGMARSLEVLAAQLHALAAEGWTLADDLCDGDFLLNNSAAENEAAHEYFSAHRERRQQRRREREAQLRALLSSPELPLSPVRAPQQPVAQEEARPAAPVRSAPLDEKTEIMADGVAGLVAADFAIC